MIRAILAVDQGNAIGWSDGRLPWTIPSDLKRFKELTFCGTVVMGRKTFESLERPDGLPGRKNIVLSSGVIDAGPAVSTIKSLNYVQASQECLGCTPGDLPDLWIIGGAQVYAQALERHLIDELYITLVQCNSGADVKLPFELYSWKFFILAQRKRGVLWDVQIQDGDRPTADNPGTTYVTLKKL
jgi:dihydrofolate reductase